MQAPETSGWLWQFKSCERGGEASRRRETLSRRIYSRRLGSARVESPRARASIISGKFQTGSRGFARAEAAGKSVNVGGSFEAARFFFFPSLSAAGDEIRLQGERDGASRRAGCGNWLPVLPKQPQTEISSEFPIPRKEYTTFPVFGATSGRRVIPFTPLKFFHSGSSDSYRICI